MEVDAALLGVYPVFGDGFRLVCLVDDFGDDLGPEVDEGGVRGGDVGAADGVSGGIFEEEGEEGEDAADEEGDDDEVDEEEDEDTASHGGVCELYLNVLKGQLQTPHPVEDGRWKLSKGIGQH